MSSASSFRVLSLAAAGSLALLAGCGSSDSGSSSTSTPAASTSTPAASTSTPAAASSGSAKGGPVAITYKDFSISPAKITVKAGSKITWTNDDDTTHNVVFKDGDPAKFTSKDFGKGGTATFTPTKPGTYNYLCTFHAGSMQGVITVTG